MLPEFGHFALILALALALMQVVVPLVGTYTGQSRLMAFARPLAAGQFVFVIFSFLVLMQSFLTDDFSVRYVAENSSALLPWYFKIGAVWGGHEGSLLLWVTILSVWTLAVAIFSRRLPQEFVARVLSVMGMISVGFLLFILLTSNPFTRFLPNSPTHGVDLNPLLQDIGLISHPPMLYMGYVGFSVAFAFAIAALMGGKLDTAWARWSRPWTTVAWAFLSCGIALGSWWAYAELGWGGWWFWDPVENASFMPWLAGTALMHTLAVTEKRGAFKSWTVLLAILTFAMSLVGTFLVRSGVLTSVHAFAASPERGKFILALLGIAVVGSLVLYAFRAPVVRSRATYEGIFSREIMLLLNNVFLLVALLLVLLGTIFPLILEGMNWGKISVGKPFFNIVFPPIVVAVAILLGLGIFSRWKRTETRHITHRIVWPAIGAIVSGVVLCEVYGAFRVWPFIGCAIAIWIVLTTARDLWEKSGHSQGRASGLRRLTRSYWGMVFGHLGLAMVILGVTIVSNYGVAHDVRMGEGDSHMINDLKFVFTGVEHVQGPNYSAEAAIFHVYRDGKPIAVLYPEKRKYTVTGQVMTEAAIDAGLFRDLYVALGEPLEKDVWAVRLQYKPMVRWIWFGAMVMAIGGALAISDRRYRIRSRRTVETDLAGGKEGVSAKPGEVSA
ncbi:heme lyase CcmF/NrfE family subunit [Mangrovitalea sediminis]|uniref:heme lyase CcmF/NrfE family subunit n=1 Tax=Mangrovitalea sediminis TaxID=1982043 RepID=UPI000BE566C2|nr:heme lyase CcmF/NrfE family subunit [Mangrovitalea sediminis]